jgi:hypothetical protein
LNKTKKILLIIVAISLSFSGFSQLNLDAKENKKIEKDKFYYGGEFLVSFGDNGRILLSPKVGYRFTKKFSVGVGLRYHLRSTLDVTTNEKQYANSFGSSTFARWELGKDLFLISDFEHLNIEQDVPTSTKKWTSFWLTGIGYQRSIEGKVKINIQLLYDILENSLTPEYYPLIPIGFPLYIRFGVTYGI